MYWMKRFWFQSMEKIKFKKLKRRWRMSEKGGDEGERVSLFVGSCFEDAERRGGAALHSPACTSQMSFSCDTITQRAAFLRLAAA